jgi:hypothetical protein
VLRYGSILVLTIAIGGTASADVTGKITLTGNAGRPPLKGRAFTDRVENPFTGGKMIDPAPYLVVVLEPTPEDNFTAPTPPQVRWRLVGESFDHPLLPVLAGTEVLIKNDGRRSPTLYCDGKDDLIAKTPLNKGGERTFKATTAGDVLTILDEDTPHLTGTVVVFDTPYVGLATSNGKREISYDLKDVPKGTYHLKVWYRSGWVDGVGQDINVDKDGKASADLTLPAGFNVPKTEAGK